MSIEIYGHENDKRLWLPFHDTISDTSRAHSKDGFAIYGKYLSSTMAEVREVHVWKAKVQLSGNFPQPEHFLDFRQKDTNEAFSTLCLQSVTGCLQERAIKYMQPYSINHTFKYTQ